MTADHLQPFPAKFASPTEDANLFVARSGKIDTRTPDHMHRHDFYEFVWLNAGNCLFFSDFQLYPLQPGTLLFISPGQLHAYIVPQSHCRITIFGFRPTLLTDIVPDLLHILPFDDSGRAPAISVNENFETFEVLFSTALDRFDRRVAGWESIATAYLKVALTEALYLLPVDVHRSKSSTAARLTRAFQRTLEQHYREMRQVTEYAAKLGVTSNHLVKAVRSTVGKTPKQMLQARLLLEAKRLLAHSDASIGEIGQLLHFKDDTSFSRWFRNQTQIAPSQFRSRSPLA